MVALGAFKHILGSGAALAALALAAPAAAQITEEAATPTGAQVPETGPEEASEGVIITGSRIRQDPNNSALPLQVITTQEIQRNGISGPEQLMQFLSSNASGSDNLASNSDVVSSAAQRGTNGLSAANLRGQGSGATLVLLNGRRVAAHGLSGSAVDVNQIPFAALERVEVLKDGASAIYGTDAIGGVINFITRTDYQGLGVQGFTDVTEHGGGEIHRLSGIAGYGDLDKNGFNLMGSASYAWNQGLVGADRDFVNGNQPNRGLSIDTRGTPIATAFALNPSATYFPGGTLLGSSANSGANAPFYLPGLVFPGTSQRADGINILDLPGGAGCESMPGGMAYDAQLWQSASGGYGCAWDTSRAVMLQQPLETFTYYGRGTVRIGGDHTAYVEVTGSNATAAKRFSNVQVSSNTSNFQVAYLLNPTTAATYNDVYNRLAAVFPAIAGNYGKPIGFRWRCLDCGQREYVTETDTLRIATGFEGPIWAGWDYRAGGSYAKSQSVSTLGSGYYYRGSLGTGAPDPNAPTAPGAPYPGLVGLLNSGILNPFSLTQTPQALAALESISARGVKLFGGKYEVLQLDASLSGKLFRVWGGDVQLAVGVDWRRETYEFNGSDAGTDSAPNIFQAAFDNANALPSARRDVKAAYAEVLVPLLDWLELSGAFRVDDYTGFGTTTNPKFSAKIRPWEPLMFRGSYGTGFRVPTFAQVFYGVTRQVGSGNDTVDPFRCPTLVVSASDPNCAAIQPDILTGGNRTLRPETSEQASVGVVFQPSPQFSASVDWWMINVDDMAVEFTTRQLLENASLFEDRFIRDPDGAIDALDRTWANGGARRTQGLDVTLRGAVEALGGTFSAGIDGTYLLKKREKLTPSAEYGPSLIGRFALIGDLGIRWKHNLFVNYTNQDWTLSLSQLFREGYKNFAINGAAIGGARPDYNGDVEDYAIYNLALSYNGLAPGYRLTFGVRNLLDKDPPFAVTYDTFSGSGGAWEPRVADPRGRSFTVAAEVKF